MIPVVISIYDRTGIMVEDWAEAGCECVCVDTRHSIRKPESRKVGKGKIWSIWGDARTWNPPANIIKRGIILFFFPPCTHVAGSGAQDFQKKGTALLRDSLEMFSICEHAARWSKLPFMIENPVGKFSDHIRPPNHIFQPWEYGDLWTKNTCLWTGNGFIIPRPIHFSKPAGTVDKIHKMGPSTNRADLRSETPKMFARAVFEANKYLMEELK